MMRTMTFLLFQVLAGIWVASFATSGAAADERNGLDHKDKVCADGGVIFHGSCVWQYECCKPDLCPTGTVFEFVKEPVCVSCKDAQTQRSIEECATSDLVRAEKDLDSVCRSLADGYPEVGQRLSEAKQSGLVFRDKFCAAYSGLHDGGSAQGEVLQRCKVGETRRLAQKLEELLKEWSALVKPHPKSSPTAPRRR